MTVLVAMVARIDPYEVLGVTHGVNLHELRLAYRRASLKYHPDTYAGDSADGHRKFTKITNAYRTISQAIREGRVIRPGELWTPRYRPQDFTRLEIGWRFIESPDRKPEAYRLGAVSFTRAAVNETRVFLMLWATAMTVAIMTAYLAIQFGIIGSGLLDCLTILPLTIGVYAIIIAATIAMLRLSRKTMLMVHRLGWLGRRSLPGK